MASQRVEMRKLRRELKIKLEVVAALTGISTGHVSRALSGKCLVSAEIMNRIESTLRAIADVRKDFAPAPLDLTDVGWLRRKIKELDRAVAS